MFLNTFAFNFKISKFNLNYSYPWFPLYLSYENIYVFKTSKFLHGKWQLKKKKNLTRKSCTAETRKLEK